MTLSCKTIHGTRPAIHVVVVRHPDSVAPATLWGTRAQARP